MDLDEVKFNKFWISVTKRMRNQGELLINVWGTDILMFIKNILIYYVFNTTVNVSVAMSASNWKIEFRTGFSDPKIITLDTRVRTIEMRI